MRVELLAPHYDGVRYYEQGSIVDWQGIPSTQMRAVDDEAKTKLDAFNANRPRPIRSPDLPPLANTVVHDPVARLPGQPRIAGPPNQVHPEPSDPANPERTAEIVEERKVVRDARAENLVKAREARATNIEERRAARAKADAEPARTAEPAPVEPVSNGRAGRAKPSE